MLNTGRSDLRFFAKISTDMPWSMSNRTVQNAAQVIFLPPLGTSLNITEKIGGLLLVDRYEFRSKRQPEAGKKKGHVTLFHHIHSHRGHYDTKYSL